MAVIIKKKAPLDYKSFVYKFGEFNEVEVPNKNTLGGKGTALSEMSRIGVPVPSGFTIPCDMSIRYLEAESIIAKKAVLIDVLKAAVEEGVSYLKYTNNGVMPLVSVRSGARVSMPGMLDTILNVGMTPETMPYWKNKLGGRASLDSYRRLLQMYGSVALGIPLEHFEKELTEVRETTGAKTDADLTEEVLLRVVENYTIIFEKHGKKMPETVQGQILGAVLAVFKSWNNPRAIEYRKLHGYPDSWGTAVTVQSMVFGNMDDNSCTGVLFTCNPSTGEESITGEYLVNAQGEDVVAGIRTPESIVTLADWSLPVWDSLRDYALMLEKHYKDMQDIEFTVQGGKLYILQTRNGKRSPQAAFKIARDMACGGMITRKEALSRVTKEQLLSLTQPKIDPSFKVKPHLVGIAAGGGLVTGVAVFTSEGAVNCTKPCVLIRQETDPDDIAGMAKAVGVLTATGGLTSHAAVVARGLNKTCVVGCTDLVVTHNFVGFPGGSFNEGMRVTLDGATGNVWVGVNVPVIPAGCSVEVQEILMWAIEGKDVSERLEIPRPVTKQGLEDVVKNTHSNNVYVDVALLGVTEEEIRTNLKTLGEVLSAYPEMNVVLDIDDMEKHYSVADKQIANMFGQCTDSCVLQSCRATAILKYPKELLDRVVVQSLGTIGKPVRKALREGGARVASSVKTFEDLLNCHALVDTDEEAIRVGFGSLGAFKKAVGMVEHSTGKKLPMLRKPGYWFDFLCSTVEE